jgi:hypothetical protein
MVRAQHPGPLDKLARHAARYGSEDVDSGVGYLYSFCQSTHFAAVPTGFQIGYAIAVSVDLPQVSTGRAICLYLDSYAIETNIADDFSLAFHQREPNELQWFPNRHHIVPRAA